jgi:reactive intermediate/imine deaminase
VNFRQIETDAAPRPSGAYSQGIAVRELLFLSGQGPFDASGRLVADSFEAQFSQVFKNLSAVAAAAGTKLSRAIRVGVYLSDLSLFDEMDRLYGEIFSSYPRPARTTIQSALVGFDIEVDAVLLLDE